MSKYIRCERCGTVDDGENIVSCGTENFYTGMVEKYSYSDRPRFEPVDLCRHCSEELNSQISDFMSMGKSDQ